MLTLTHNSTCSQLMMIMMRRFVKRILNSPQTRCLSQSNRWDLRCRANDRGESVVVQRAAGRLFQICGPATAKLFIRSAVIVLGTNSVPVSADRRCCLLAIAVKRVKLGINDTITDTVAKLGEITRTAARRAPLARRL